MIEVPLTQGKVALIDDEDADRVLQYKWCANHISGFWYATASIRLNGKRPLMHRLILDAPDEFHVDHKNHDGLDNRRSNIRLCTYSGNQANRRKQSTKSSSQYKGVAYHASHDRWQATIRVDRKKIWLGMFLTEIEAARAYDEAAERHFGEYAYTNGV